MTFADPTARVNALRSGGYSWVPIQTLYGLVDSGLSNADIQSSLKTMTSASIAQDKNPKSGALHLFFDDPVLQKAPSAALALKQYISGAYGPWPVAQAHLGTVQTNLQIRGYGRDLPSDGTWSASWQNALSQYKEDSYNKQRSSGGGFSFGHVINFLNDILSPTGAGNALIGFVKSLGPSARQLVADVAGGTAYGVHSIAHPSDFGTEKGRKVEFDAIASVETALGKKTSSNQVRQTLESPEGYRRLLEDSLNVLTLTSIMGAGSRMANAVSEGVSGSLDYAAASRGPGVIAKSLLGGQTEADIAAGVSRGGLLNTKVFQNIPILGRTGPILGKLADADGLYYRTRTLLATPYAYAPVRAAGNVLGQTLLAGGIARTAAQVEGKQSILAQNIDNTHTLDTVDTAIKNRLQFSLFGATIRPSINDLVFFLHPTGHVVSATAGDAITAPIHNFAESLGRTGTEAAIQRATGLSTDELVQAAGGYDRFAKFWGEKVAEHASAFAAQDAYNRTASITAAAGGEPLGSEARLAALQALQHDFRVNRLDEAMTLTMGQTGESLVQSLKREISLSRMSPKDYARNYVNTYLDAVDEARNNLLPHVNTLVNDRGDQALIHARDIPNGFGLARSDTLTRQEALQAIAEFRAWRDDLEARINAPMIRNRVEEGRQGMPGLKQSAPTTIIDTFTNPIRPSIAELRQYDQQLTDFLYRELGVRAKDIPGDTHDMLDYATRRAKNLAVGIQLHPDAPQEIKDSFARLADLGYKPVQGTDIGWMLRGPAPLDVLDGPIKTQRRFAEHLGLNPDLVTNRNVSQARYTNQLDSVWHELEGSHPIQLPPTWTPATVMDYLTTQGIIDNPAGPFRGAAQSLFRTPQRLASKLGITVEEARRELEQAPFPLIDLPRKQVVEALTSYDKVESYSPAATGLINIDHPLEALHPPMTVDDAERVYRALVRGAAKTEMRMVGLTHLEDLFRASMGFAGKGIAWRAGAGAVAGAAAAKVTGQSPLEGAVIGGGLGAVGGDRLGWAMANLPNRLVQLRNEFRFDLSPYFSLRRIAKTNFKLGLEGIAPTVNPAATMREAGTLEQDRATLARIFPTSSDRWADEMDRYIHQQDIFGLYNGRDFEAYGAGQWARQGLSDEQIKAKIIRTFEYGVGGDSGRSALEKSANFIFFPFSFDKTVYRNLGSYLLDKPAQRVLLTRALASYAEFNAAHENGTNPLAVSFYKKHAPVLEEAANLNMFLHGVSLGEVGGINRPLLNLFLPQSWTPSASSSKTLTRFAPVIKDAGDVLNSIKEQGSILAAVGDNMWRDLHGIPATYGAPARSTLTKSAQLTEAFAMQRSWYSAYANIIDHNASTQNQANKVRFPLSPEWGRWAGEPITKANIRAIIQERYPSYSAEGAITSVTTSNENYNNWLLDQKTTGLYSYAKQFTDDANALGRQLDSTSPRFTAAQISSFTDSLRQQAIYLASRDSRFYSLYNRNFGKILGPLEKVNG